LWAQGGMQIDEVLEQIMEQQLHLLPLPTPIGIDALMQSAKGTDSQYLLRYGHLEKIKLATF
jgi:hypothetical protein